MDVIVMDENEVEQIVTGALASRNGLIEFLGELRSNREEENGQDE